jgi:hypothetical protein
MTTYLEVPPYIQPDHTLRLADWAAEIVAKLLDMEPVAIRWFVRGTAAAGWPWETWEDEDDKTAGRFFAHRPRTIWVKVGLSAWQTVATVAHEIQHAKHHRDLSITTAGSPEAETIAEDFGQAVARRLVE